MVVKESGLDRAYEARINREEQEAEVQTVASEPHAADQWELRRWSHHVKSTFRHAWAEQPERAWQPWLTTMIIGWILCAGLMVGMAYGMRALQDSSVLAWEKPWLQGFVDASPLSITKVLYLGLPGHTLSVLFMVALTAVIAILLHRPLDAMSIAFGVGLMTCIVLLGWQLAARARPDLVLEGALAPGLHSFPSGHVAHATFLYGLLAYFWARQTPRWGERLLAVVLCVVLLLAVGAGRLLEGAHWPTDVLASYLVGGVWLAAVITALRRVPRHSDDHGDRN